MCYTNYLIDACEELDSAWAGIYEVNVYSSTGSCGGGYNCNINTGTFDGTGIENCLD